MEVYLFLSISMLFILSCMQSVQLSLPLTLVVSNEHHNFQLIQSKHELVMPRVLMFSVRKDVCNKCSQ